jgi:hypothetical protein
MTFTNVLLRRHSEIRKLVRIMKRFRFAPGLACALVMCGCGTALGQASTDAVRVTMSMHPDGSRTVYNFDNVQHTAVSTTTDPDGKVRQTIRYQLDNAGRFSTGEVSGPDGRVRLKSRYKYDDAGRILEEAQSAANGRASEQDRLQLRSSGQANWVFCLRRVRQTSEPRRRLCDSPISIAKIARKHEAIAG